MVALSAVVLVVSVFILYVTRKEDSMAETIGQAIQKIEEIVTVEAAQLIQMQSAQADLAKKQADFAKTQADQTVLLNTILEQLTLQLNLAVAQKMILEDREHKQE
jgi:hypothetical protein